MTPEQLAELVAERIDYDRLADAIVARLEWPIASRRDGTPADALELVSAKEIAARIGRSPEWGREHKAELGAVPMSEGGKRPRLGFNPAHVVRVLAERRL